MKQVLYDILTQATTLLRKCRDSTENHDDYDDLMIAIDAIDRIRNKWRLKIR